MSDKINSVTISLSHYNELKNSQKKSLAHTILIHDGSYRSYTIQTDVEATKIIAERLKEAVEEIDKLEYELKTVNRETEAVEDLLGRNWLEFLTWRKRERKQRGWNPDLR